MAEITAVRSKTRKPTPPGKVLAGTVLPASGKSKTEIARLLGVSDVSKIPTLELA